MPATQPPPTPADPPPRGRLPMILVTGFLGSGKTTLLRRVAEREAKATGRRLVLLVNEFASLDVDGRALEDDIKGAAQVVAVPGGSIFCTCLVARFLKELKALVARHHEAPIDALLVEASGAANPAVVGQLLRETGLDQQIDLRRTVCVADPVSLPRLIETLPNVKSQLAAADLVVLNKADLGGVEATAQCKAIINEYAPGAALHVCEHAEPCPDLLGGGGPLSERAGELAGCQDPHFAKSVFAPGEPVDREALLGLLEAWRERAYRVKGVLDTDAGPVVVSLTQAGLSWSALPGSQSERGLALIAKPTDLPHLSLALSRLPRGRPAVA